MRSIPAKFAAILTVLAFVAFESGADAQARRGESRPSASSKPSGQVERKQPSTRPSVNTSNDRKPSTTVTRPSSRPSGQVRPPAGTSSQTRPSVERPASQTRPSATRPSNQTRPSPARPSNQASPSVTRPSGQHQRPSGNAGTPVKPGNNGGYNNPDRDKPVSVTRPGTRPARPANSSAGRPSVRPDAGHAERPGKPDKPVQVRPDRRPEPPRVHPHDRDFIVYDRPSHFWTGHNHCYGHRVRILPSHVRRHIYHGVTYYCYNDIWYRPYGGYYVVCRPPRGTVLAANLIADMTWAAVRLSYYYTVANTYSKIAENNAYIAEQNAIIAQNNATIAAQNQTIAMNQQLASQAYGLANELGLVQSYAAADGAYYYQDGVFYSMDTDGEYKVILPPAGALVETLPEDYEMITLGGNEYYKVDDTVYRVIISDGKPYFEVLGQLYA